MHAVGHSSWKAAGKRVFVNGAHRVEGTIVLVVKDPIWNARISSGN